MSKSILYGIYTTIGLVLYFLFMKVIGQETNFYLRIFNAFIVIGGVYALFKQRINSGKPMTYFQGLGMGFLMTITTVFSFIIFLGAYVSVVDPSFISVLESSGMWGSNLTLGQAVFAIFIEGMASGAVISYAWMQYFKKYASVSEAI